jgi:hypothetical protein
MIVVMMMIIIIITIDCHRCPFPFGWLMKKDGVVYPFTLIETPGRPQALAR